MVFTVNGYRRGKHAPYEEALDLFSDTSTKLFDKVMLWVTDYLSNSDYHVMPHVEPLGKKLYALRVSQGGNNARLFFTKTPGRQIWLLNGYCKKSRKIPPDQLDKARKLCEEVQRLSKQGDLYA